MSTQRVGEHLNKFDGTKIPLIFYSSLLFFYACSSLGKWAEFYYQLDQDAFFYSLKKYKQNLAQWMGKKKTSRSENRAIMTIGEIVSSLS